MGKLELVKKGAKELFDKNLPDLLVGTGIILNGWGLVSGIKATPKAVDILNAEKEMKGEDLTIKETIKATWKLYLPTAIEVVLGNACIIGGTVCFHKRNASLLALCSLSETTLGLYKDKLVEAVGKEKAEEIEQQVTDEKLALDVKKNAANNTSLYLPNGDGTCTINPRGEVPCYDEYSGRIFMSRQVDIDAAVNKCNAAILEYDEVCLNEFYYEIGLDGIEMGSDFGWTSSDRLIEIKYGSKTIDGIPYLTITFVRRPKPMRTYMY